MDDVVDGMSLPGGALECTCGDITYETGKAKNWMFDCPMHGIESDWFKQKSRGKEAMKKWAEEKAGQ